jgi:hypothetical protein
MVEGTTGTLVGGIIASIGSVLGLLGGLVPLGQANAASSIVILGIINRLAAIVVSTIAPTISLIWSWLVLTASTIALILSIFLFVGKSIKTAAIIIVITETLIEIIFNILAQNVWMISGILQMFGSIIVLATGASK